MTRDKKPKIVTVNPNMVGIVACEKPLPIKTVFSEPCILITSKTSIIPVTVPNKPNKGAITINCLMRLMFFLLWCSLAFVARYLLISILFL